MFTELQPFMVEMDSQSAASILPKEPDQKTCVASDLNEPHGSKTHGGSPMVGHPTKQNSEQLWFQMTDMDQT